MINILGSVYAGTASSSAGAPMEVGQLYKMRVIELKVGK
jgi:hypothetical protein